MGSPSPTKPEPSKVVCYQCVGAPITAADVKTDESFEVCGVGCKSWFCEECCVHKGVKIRERLIPVLSTFTRCIMFTLTIDPKQFKTPEEAHKYLTKNRCVSELMRKLRDSGHLASSRYFCVKEFQKNTQQTHYHLLVDSPFVPIQLVRDTWGKNVPADYIRAEGDNSPAFGSVNFTAPKFESSRHAAFYATKYLIKTPEEGWPDWVMHSKNRITRYTTSRGFWPQEEEEEDHTEEWAGPKGKSTIPTCVDICFCEICRGDKPGIKEEPKTQIKERVKACCSRSVLLRVIEWMRPDGELVKTRVFEAALEESPQEIARRHQPAEVGRKRIVVNDAIAEIYIKRARCDREDSEIHSTQSRRQLFSRPPDK